MKSTQGSAFCIESISKEQLDCSEFAQNSWVPRVFVKITIPSEVDIVSRKH